MGFTANSVPSIQKVSKRFSRMGLSDSADKDGRVAQLVEQVTFNHWVTGSNPVALTNLYDSKSLKALAFSDLFLSGSQAERDRMGICDTCLHR